MSPSWITDGTGEPLVSNGRVSRGWVRLPDADPVTWLDLFVDADQLPRSG